jgi:hypothetical protein
MSDKKLEFEVKGKKAWISFEEWKALTAWMRGDKPKENDKRKL